MANKPEPRRQKIVHLGITVELIFITPEMAETFLEANTHNRPLKGKLDGFIRDMEERRWEFNGDTIRVAKDGTLLDGQHRLFAIVGSGVGQWCLVVHGLANKIQDTIDQGTARSHSDQLRLDGEQNAVFASAVMAYVIPLLSGATAVKTIRPTLTEKNDFLAEHGDLLRESARLAQRSAKKVPGSPSSIGAAHFLCARVDEKEALYFFEHKLIDHYDWHAGDPAAALHARFTNLRASGVRVEPDEAIRYCLLAWNHWRAGRMVSKLQAPRGGWGKGKFPWPN